MPSEKTLVPAANGDDLLALVELALEEARVLGATQAEAAVSVDVGLSVSVRLGEVETVEYQRDRGMGVTVYFGTRKGSASTADLGAAGLRETVAKACSIARFTAEDPCAGLADPDTLAREIPDLSLSHPWELTPEQACDLALACESAAMGVDPRITNSEGAGVSSHRGLRAYGTSHGFLAAYPGTVHSISCAVLGSEGETMERDYWYSTARDWRELEEAASVGRRSGERAVTASRCAQVEHDEGAGPLQSRCRARPGESFHRRDPRWQPVPARLVPARLRRAAGFPGLVRDFGAPARAEGTRERAVRSRGRCDAGPRARRRRRGARLRAQHLLGAQARPAGPPAMPAARTTWSCTGAAATSTRCSRTWAGGCSSPS